MTAHIVAMGGGGFSMSPFGAPTNLDRYLVELTGKSSPLVCFAPTASADDPQYINKFLLAYGTLGVRTMVLTLWEGGSAGSVARLADADLLLVGGGHTVNLMALWQAHGVDAAIRARYAEGEVVLAGVSAGGSCWYTGCITDSFGDFRPWRGGLGLVPGSFCPHFDGEAERAPPTPTRSPPVTCPGATAPTTVPASTTSTGCPPTSSPKRPASVSTACCRPTCPPRAASWSSPSR